MSDSDYTKKPENGNSDNGIVARAGKGRRLRVWLYESAYLYKGRADKLIIGFSMLALCFVGAGLAYLGTVFQAPADIVVCQPG